MICIKVADAGLSECWRCRASTPPETWRSDAALSDEERPMFAYSAADDRIEQTAHEAFEIAWNFLKCSDDVGDPAVAQVIIAAEIMGLLARGERKKLRLANLAISAFQTSQPVKREARPDSVYAG